jgi:hypothetical protein
MATEGQRGSRHSIRLPDYDDRSPGAYFGTVCTSWQESLLGQVLDDEL